MRRRELFLFLLIVICLLHQTGDVQAQSTNADDRKLEVAGQFTLLTTSIVSQVNEVRVPCVTPPCPLETVDLSRTRKTQPGFGGRIGYNLNSSVALEAEVNFFPGADSFTEPGEFNDVFNDVFNDGYFLEGLFGVKAGKRFEKVGIFGKARPGFLYASKGDLEPKPNTACLAVFPTPVGCFQPTGINSFALDVGGVVEVYPTARTVIRFDFGDTIVRFRARSIATNFRSSNGFVSRGVFWPLPAETTHNFQGSVGIGFRF